MNNNIIKMPCTFSCSTYPYCGKVISIGMSGTKTSLLMKQLNDVEAVFTSEGDNRMEESDKSISPCPWNALQNKNMGSKMLSWTLFFITALSDF